MTVTITAFYKFVAVADGAALRAHLADVCARNAIKGTILVAPEGISRRELARPLYEEFRNAPKKTRDWAREMEDAQRQIDETIGRDGRWSPAPRDPAGKQS